MAELSQEITTTVLDLQRQLLAPGTLLRFSALLALKRNNVPN